MITQHIYFHLLHVYLIVNNKTFIEIESNLIRQIAYATLHKLTKHAVTLAS